MSEIRKISLVKSGSSRNQDGLHFKIGSSININGIGFTVDNIMHNKNDMYSFDVYVNNDIDGSVMMWKTITPDFIIEYNVSELLPDID